MPTNVQRVIVNRYRGQCVLCGGQVLAGAGEAVLPVGDRWQIRHLPDQCQTTLAQVESHQQVEQERARTDQLLPDVPAGHYAVPALGHNDLDFYRVDRPTEGVYAGRTFVKRVIGGRPNVRLPRLMVRDVLVRIVAAGIQEAATKYGQEIGRCYMCNRHLTDETSRLLGIGPDCRGRSRRPTPQQRMESAVAEVAAERATRAARLASEVQSGRIAGLHTPPTPEQGALLLDELGGGEVL